MKWFIIVFKKIAHVAIKSRSVGISGLLLGPRQAKTGVTLTMGQRRNSPVSSTQSTVRRWRLDAQGALAFRAEYCWYSDPRAESLAIPWAAAAGSEAAAQRPQIELADVDGFFASLILRFVRAGSQSAWNLAAADRLPDKRHYGSVPATAQAIATRLASSKRKPVVSEPFEALLIELAHRHAQIAPVGEGSAW